jgi:glycosyltransferase involved in cell wall biosynthesis
VLPRLLYLGDVPVESSYHGSTLLYRLLQRYPAGRLRIIEGNIFPPRTDRRLPGAAYATLRVGRDRLLNSRFHDAYSRWLHRGARRRTAKVMSLLDGFAPEAVLTVAHGYSWVTAAQFARQAKLPLHLIIHDDWPRLVPAAMQSDVERDFTDVYRQARTRWCVSPFMAEDYERRYDAPGTILLPYRAADAPAFTGVAERLTRDARPLVFAFAGSINSPGYTALLRTLASCLGPMGHELVIFGPLTPEHARSSGLDLPNVRLGGLLASADLLPRLRAEADVLFAPMSFAPQDRDAGRMNFPSKLSDYTLVGLPLLIAGPPDCSAVQWANANRGVAELVTSEGAQAMVAAVERLAGDSTHRVSLARRAQEVGDRDFSAAAAYAIFEAGLNAA